MARFVFAFFILGYLLMGIVGAATATLFLWPGLLAFAVGGVAGLLLLRGRTFAHRPSALCLFSTLAFTGYLVARAATSPVPFNARPDLFLLLGCFICYVGVAVLFEGGGYRKTVAGLLVVLALGNVLVGIYQYVTDGDFHVLSSLGYSRNVPDKQAGGFFNLGNHLAGFLEVGGPLALGLALFGNLGAGRRLALFFVFLFCGIGLALSTSRGGLLGAGASMAVFLLLALAVTLASRNRGRFLAGAGAALVVLAGVALLAVVNYRFFQEHFGGDFLRESGIRRSMWEMALRQFEISPVVGTGAGTFFVYAREFMPNSIMWLGVHEGMDATYAHNDYLQLLAEYGLVGFALAGLVVVAHLANGARYLAWFRRERYLLSGASVSTDLGIVLGSMAVVAAYAVHSFLDFNLHLGANAVAVATVFGFLANPGREIERNVPSGPRTAARTVLVVLSAVAGGFILWKVIPYARADLHLEGGKRIANSGSLLKSLYHFAKAEELDPDNFKVQEVRGAVLAALAEEEDIPALARSWRIRAVESLENSRTIFPDNLYTLAALADQLSLLGAFDDADRLYAAALERGPNFRFLWFQYAQHLLRAGRIQDGRRALERAVELHWYGEEAAEARRWIQELEKLEARNPG